MFLASKFASPSKSTNLLIPDGLAPIEDVDVVRVVVVAGGVVVVVRGTSAPPPDDLPDDELPDDELPPPVGKPVSGSIPPPDELPPPDEVLAFPSQQSFIGEH